MKKIYYCLYSLIVLLFLTDDCFASVVSHEENEVRSEVSIRKINRMALGDFRVDDNPKQHYVFFDVDGVLLSEGGSQKNADLLSSQTLQFILGLQQQGVKCFALTARQPRRFLETFQRLNMFGLNFNHPGMGIDFLQSGTRYFKGIIHSPDDKSSDARISSKLQTLQAFMEHLASLGHKSTRISFIDDNAYHFAEQYQKKLNLNQPLDLYHYKRTFAPLYSSWQDLGEYSSQRDKIPNFSELKFVKTLSGGSGGVQVFIDPNGKQWTLKSWKNKHHGINECLAGAMYQKAGGHFPNFYLFNDVPECIKQQLGDTKLHRGGLYRLAEFVEGSQPTQEQLTELLAPNFASLALLSAWDIKPENFIITAEGALYLIDSGGALLHRSLGHRKMATRAKAAKDDMWFRHQVSEFASFRQGDTFGARNFAEITPENIKLQISQLLTARDQLLQQARDFCQAVRYEDTQELLQFFESRLQHLRFLDDFFDGKINPKADPFAFASLNDAAGTLIYKMEDGKPYILLGKRTRHNWWGNLGGKADAGERFYEAGARETLEESGDHLNFQSDILYMPSHDTVTVEDNLTLKRFRTYLAKVDHIDPQTLLQKLTDSSHAKEYSEFAWIAVEEVLQALESGDLVQEENQATIAIVPGGPVLHPPFLQSLQQPQIKQWLQALVSGKEIAGTCSQSVVGHPGLQEITEVVEDPATSSAQRMALWLSLAAQKQAQQQRANKLLKITAEANTASHNMLQHLLDAEAFKISVQDQIKKVIPCLNQKEAELLESIIDQEKFHNDKFVLYHGFDTDLWFNCCVLSSVRHMLDVSPEQTDMLRSLDNFSMEYQNANDLLNFILMGKTNYSKGFKCAGLSCNPTLFNNLRVSSSSTHAYFSGQSSLKPPRPWDITKTMFETLGITTDVLLHDLKALYQNHFGNFNGGALLQIFLKSEIVNQACYIAGSVGATVQDSTDQTVRQALPVLQSLKSGQDPQVQRNTSNIQVRLLADLAKFAPGAVVVQDYLYNAREYNARVNAAQIKQDLKRMLTPYLFPILSKLVCNQEVYSSRAPQTLEILRKTIGIEPYELQACQTPKIVKALNDKQYAEVLNCIIEDPDCLERTYVDDPDSLTENVVKDLQEITSMQQIISDISPEKCQQLFAPVEKLMTTQSWEKEMDKFLQIVKSVNAINCPNPSEFCKEVHHLIPSSAYSSDILRILEALGAMNLTDPAGFCRAVRPLISDAASVLGYLKDMQLSDPVSFCNAVRPLIKVSEYSSDAASVLGYLKDMQLSDPVSFCNAVRPLIKVSEYSSDAARVLGYLKDMQLSDPVSFCNAVRSLIEVSEYSSDTVSVLGYLKDMQLSDPVSFCNAVRPLIEVLEYSSDTVSVLGYCKKEGLLGMVHECQVSAIEAALEVVNDPMTAHEVAKIIKAINNLPLADPQTFCRAAKQFIVAKASPYQVIETLQLLQPINPDDIDKFFQEMQPFFVDDVGQYNINKILDIRIDMAQKMDSESASSLLALLSVKVNSLLPESVSQYNKIIKLLNIAKDIPALEIENYLQAAQTLVPDSSLGSFNDVLKEIIDIKPANLEVFAEIAQYLLNRSNTEKTSFNVTYLLGNMQSLKDVKSEEATNLLEAAKKCINPDVDDREAIAIFAALKDVDDYQRLNQAAEILMDIPISRNIAECIQILKEYNQDDLPQDHFIQVCQATKELAQPSAASVDAILKFLCALNPKDIPDYCKVLAQLKLDSGMNHIGSKLEFINKIELSELKNYSEKAILLCEKLRKDAAPFHIMKLLKKRQPDNLNDFCEAAAELLNESICYLYADKIIDVLDPVDPKGYLSVKVLLKDDSPARLIGKLLKILRDIRKEDREWICETVAKLSENVSKKYDPDAYTILQGIKDIGRDALEGYLELPEVGKLLGQCKFAGSVVAVVQAVNKLGLDNFGSIYKDSKFLIPCMKDEKEWGELLLLFAKIPDAKRQDFCNAVETLVADNKFHKWEISELKIIKAQSDFAGFCQLVKKLTQRQSRSQSRSRWIDDCFSKLFSVIRYDNNPDAINELFQAASTLIVEGANQEDINELLEFLKYELPTNTTITEFCASAKEAMPANLNEQCQVNSWFEKFAQAM